jgi:uncharacterized protein
MELKESNHSSVTVIKHNHLGQERWRYTGNVLKRAENAILIQAYFDRQDLPFHGIVLAQGDRFLEVYFSDRWYNIFEIHDRQDDHLKGWYCNLTRPAEISRDTISYIDMALDLLVYPDHTFLVLDEDEYEDLGLPVEIRQQVMNALEELKGLFSQDWTLDRGYFL